ncbi:MAG: adenosylcobinamide-phosphate synthase CbiB [Syntrophales bacterium]
MSLELQILLALVLDFIIGDPRGFPHPVRWIGSFALAVENPARRRLKNEKAAGIAAALVVIGTTGLAVVLLVKISGGIHPYAGDAASVLILYTAFAARDLADHSEDVRRALEAGNLPEARRKVSRMVGRDTEGLDEKGVARAAVESVAENTVDGVVAPLLYAMLFGPAGAMIYKAVNTLDSTFGYRNERYISFGWASAKIDDLANWMPARLSVLLIAAAAPLAGMNPGGAIRTGLRDGRNHPSPNSGWSEAAFAGALKVQLGGPLFRKGKPDDMPAIGDPGLPLDAARIRRANALMMATAVVAFFVFGGIRLALK